MHILGEIYGSHTAVTHAHKVTHNRRRQRVQSPAFSPLCHWSRPELFHSICLWWNSRLLCHSQFAFLMTEAETTGDKTWQGSRPRRQVTRLLFCEGPERERAEWDVSASDVTFWSASQRRDMWLRWRGWAHNYSLMAQKGGGRGGIARRYWSGYIQCTSRRSCREFGGGWKWSNQASVTGLQNGWTGC